MIDESVVWCVAFAHLPGEVYTSALRRVNPGEGNCYESIRLASATEAPRWDVLSIPLCFECYQDDIKEQHNGKRS